MKKLTVIIPIIIFVISGLIGSIFWVQSSINSAILPVEARAERNTDDISIINSQLSAINTKLDFILGKYGYQYSNGQIITK